jgi:hypothetical protein
MKQDEIIEMAEQAGMLYMDYIRLDSMKQIEALIKLAAAKAEAKEREACARVCERTKGLDRGGWPQHYEAHELAAAIRARGQA